MLQLEKAFFASGTRLVARTALPLLGVLALAGPAGAQQPNPFGPPPPLPPGAGAAPAPGAPTPGPAAPAPGAPGANPFGAPPGNPFGPGAAPAPGATPAPGDTTTPPATDQPAPPAEPTPADEEKERWLGLMEQTNLSGSTGLLHTSYAGSGPAGTFRVSFLTDFFTAGGFLCRPGDIASGPNAANPMGTDKRCASPSGKLSPNQDTTSRVGGTFVINATPWSFLEAYVMLRTYATSNDQGDPQLLQVLGDTTIGVKGFLPPKLGRIFTFGGEAQLLLLNGTGGVGIAGAGTSALFRAMANADFRKLDGGAPIRAGLNIGYKLDNSGQLVNQVEQDRGKAQGYNNTGDHDPNQTNPIQPITRIERFGLGINKVDSLPLALSVELPFTFVQPYLEWSIDVPVNRQGYYCHTGRVSHGDVCLGLGDINAANPGSAGGPGAAAVPSRFTIGARTNPLPMKTWHGLSAHVAIDIGTTGVHTYIEEMAPQAPWTMYLGLGFVYDTKEPPPPVAPPAPPPPPPVVLPAPQTLVRGTVHEQGKNDVLVADAIVSFEGNVQPPLATGADGKFLSRNLEPGTYKLNIKAPGFKPGACSATVEAHAAPSLAPAAPAAPTDATPGAAPNPFGAPPGAPGAPPGGATPPATAPVAPVPAAPTGPIYVDIDCPLEGLPKLGGIYGVVRDADSGQAVGGATIKLIDGAGKEISVSADGSGNFVFKDLQPGAVMIKGEASGYMSHNTPVEVRIAEDVRPTIQLAKRPKTPSVKVEGKEIKISRQIHFETDSAKILGDSNSLMEEIADVLQRSPGLKKVEIQGHTDNTGTREHNLQLSDARANAVKAWLVGAGIEGTRLVGKGYGQDRPLVPNVTAANRGRNRRVQFIILEGK